MEKLPKEESVRRIQALFDALDASGKDWDTALIIDRVNQYYFTGTMQDGILVLKRGGAATLFVRRSYQRALEESSLNDIRPIKSYRDMLSVLDGALGGTFVETEMVPVAVLERIQKHFTMDAVYPLDRLIQGLRAVKSAYELALMEEAGRRHDKVLRELVPGLLKEGMSEARFMAELYRAMVGLGHQGLIRFSGFQNEIAVGQFGFGESTLYPTNFDGPGGMRGMSPLLPAVGSPERFLKKGDLVFVDMAFGFWGYQTDKTQVYAFKGRPPEEAVRLHSECMKVQAETAALLKPGNIPSEIYTAITARLSPELAENFMGGKNRRAPFIGHGIGLYVDEHPVLALGFDAPLQNGMVLALEPKAVAPPYGTVGAEETYVVTDAGGRCITGGAAEIMEI